MAEMLLAEGTSVAVFDRSSSEEAQAALTAIAARNPGTRCEFFRADVSDAAGLDTVVLEAAGSLELQSARDAIVKQLKGRRFLVIPGARGNSLPLLPDCSRECCAGLVNEWWFRFRARTLHYNHERGAHRLN